jgi:hypothetical protein
MSKEKQTAEEIEAILIKAMTSFDLSKQVFQIQQIINQQTSEMQKEIDLLTKEKTILIKQKLELNERFESYIRRTEKQLVEVTHKHTTLKQSADELKEEVQHKEALIAEFEEVQHKERKQYNLLKQSADEMVSEVDKFFNVGGSDSVNLFIALENYKKLI